MNRLASLALVAAVCGAAACAHVLGFKPPKGPHPFEHRAHAVEGIHCQSCHGGVELAGESGPLHLPSDERCVECHEEPHNPASCRSCHGTQSTRRAAVRARDTLRFEHRTHLPGMKGDCVRCHIDAGEGGPRMRPRMVHCLSCHEHQDQVEANDCQPCHVDLKHEGTMPEDHLVHGADFIARHGAKAAANRQLCSNCHNERFCTECHSADLMLITPERMAFSDPFAAGVHRAGFLSRHAEEAQGDPGLCTTCHTPDRCRACHERQALDATRPGSRSPHPPGWVGPPGTPNRHGRATWRDPASCEACHGGAGEQLCVGCHRVGAPGGSPHPPGWSPGRAETSSYPCVRCHTGGRIR